MNAMISIVMPCYNDGQYIIEAIESVWKQTYTNWELIIVDDGSDDENTIQTIENIEKVSRIRVFHKEHLGPAGARNFGIVQAKGKYILPLDSDDKIHCEYLKKAVQIIEGDSKIGVVYCQADLFGEKEGRWNLPDYSFKTMLLDNIVFVSALFYKCDWEKVGGFRTTMVNGMEDYDFWLSLLEIGREIYQIPEVLFHYRIKPVSRTTSFQDNCTQVQDTYRQLYYNHTGFYKKYYDEYVTALRDSWIEQLFIKRKYEERWAKITQIVKYPFVGKLLKKLIK